MNILRKAAILLMSIVALLALCRSIVKAIEYDDGNDEVSESGKFMNSLPENTVVILMLIGIGVVYKPSKK